MGEFGVRGYEKLPDWVKAGNEPDPRLRDFEEEKVYGETQTTKAPAGDILDRAVGNSKVVVGSPAVQQNSKGKEKAKTLDDWLAEESEKEGSEDEDDDEEDDEEESEEESEEETDEDGEDESEAEGEGDRLVKPAS